MTINDTGKVVVIEFVTLDGVMQVPGRPNEDGSNGFKYGVWTIPYDDELHLGKAMARTDVTGGACVAARPGIKEATKYVVSNIGLLKVERENSVLLTDDVSERIKKLKSGNDPEFHVWGSGALTQTRLKNDLVDELWLKILPIVLGHGKKLFAAGAVPRSFRLIKSLTGTSGVMLAN